MVSVSDFDRIVFVVGAPRCGTTTLAGFLKQHPAICFPSLKEPHYFAQNDLRTVPAPQLRLRVEDEYLTHFFRWEPARRIAADGSVTYLYVPEQLEPALQLWPESQFVVALRDPLHMLPSLHRRLLYNGDETIRQFERAWAASSQRAAGTAIPSRCIDPRFLRYDEACRFGTYVERLFAAVGRERCHVVLFDDLAADPAGEYLRLVRFLGLDPVESVDLGPRRPGLDVRSVWLQRLLKRPPKALREGVAAEQFQRRFDTVEVVGQSAPGKLLALRKRLLQWNRVSPRRQSFSPILQSDIQRRLQPEIDRLGALIGRDLSSWLQPTVPSVVSNENGES